jgi:hypothetical protein
LRLISCASSPSANEGERHKRTRLGVAESNPEKRREEKRREEKRREEKRSEVQAGLSAKGISRFAAPRDSARENSSLRLRLISCASSPSANEGERHKRAEFAFGEEKGCFRLPTATLTAHRISSLGEEIRRTLAHTQQSLL